MQRRPQVPVAADATLLSQPWQQRIAAAAAGTAPGLIVRLTGGAVAPPLQLVAYGGAVIAAAFMLAWASEAAQAQTTSGIVVAAVAFVAILPEYVVEVHFAFTGTVDYVTANLTGASRLLLGVCVAMPAIVALLPRAGRPVPAGPIVLAPPVRVELAILGIAGVWILRIATRGALDLLDALVLVGLYALYLRRTSDAEAEAPAPIGVAEELAALPPERRRRWVRALMLYSALVILVVAVPFGNAVLATGALVGVSPYIVLQWLVPVATETPELVVAFVLLAHGRGGQSVMLLLAGAVSQYTLALGTLPVAYLAGAGTGPLPMAGREQIEVFLSGAVALYVVGGLIALRLSRGDAAIMLVLFGVQFLIPVQVARAVLALVFATLAADVLLHDRRHLPALVRALLPPRRRAGARGP